MPESSGGAILSVRPALASGKRLRRGKDRTAHTVALSRSLVRGAETAKSLPPEIQSLQAVRQQQTRDFQFADSSGDVARLHGLARIILEANDQDAMMRAVGVKNQIMQIRKVTMVSCQQRQPVLNRKRQLLGIGKA